MCLKIRNTKSEIKKVNWKWEYGVYVAFCPYCDELAYKKDHCCFCKKPYKWAKGKYKDTVVEVGEYTIIQATNNHISIYKNGEHISHSSCTKKYTKAELIEYLEQSKKLWKMLEEETK